MVNSGSDGDARRRQLHPNKRTLQGKAAAAGSGHNQPHAVQQSTGRPRSLTTFAEIGFLESRRGFQGCEGGTS
jgi:hypothetical protein